MPQSLPNDALVTTEGIPISWKKQEVEGFWVKLTAEVDGDAVFDPLDSLFESGDIRELVDSKETHFKFLNEIENYRFFASARIQMERIYIYRHPLVTYITKKPQ